MIKPNISSECTAVGKLPLICPKCERLSDMPVFKTQTTVNISSVALHELKSSHFAVCKSCCSTIEVSEWKS